MRRRGRGATVIPWAAAALFSRARASAAAPPGQSDQLGSPSALDQSDAPEQPDLRGRPDPLGQPDLLHRPDVLDRSDPLGRSDPPGESQPPGLADVLRALDRAQRAEREQQAAALRLRRQAREQRELILRFRRQVERLRAGSAAEPAAAAAQRRADAAPPPVERTEDHGICADTDDGAADNSGAGCVNYTNSSLWCSSYDDSDFTSLDMCCACGGGGSKTGSNATSLPPTPSPVHMWAAVSGECTLGGSCVESPNYPQNYGVNQECTVEIDFGSAAPIHVESFNTESGCGFRLPHRQRSRVFWKCWSKWHHTINELRLDLRLLCNPEWLEVVRRLSTVDACATDACATDACANANRSTDTSATDACPTTDSSLTSTRATSTRTGAHVGSSQRRVRERRLLRGEPQLPAGLRRGSGVHRGDRFGISGTYPRGELQYGVVFRLPHCQRSGVFWRHRSQRHHTINEYCLVF
ncbi:unnamed protein product [Prorocentrum cordatum]|uniref:CUB domain-containing protein n=1 Tax=Prorocentrum cordatum TaxID=2364126 RepID=A0ABN9V9V8_9DINO|nr:unnamed protein product [Polarella glacialis]